MSGRGNGIDPVKESKSEKGNRVETEEREKEKVCVSVIRLC